MSTTTTEEDTELRDLVATTLENAGVLGKIKAELRANVYIALEEGDGVKSKSKLVNNKLTAFLSTTNGRLVASLVREFLEFFDLNFTMAVFDPETNIGELSLISIICQSIIDRHRQQGQNEYSILEVLAMS